MENISVNPMDHFQIGDGAISLTEQGRRFAGSSANTPGARGNFLAGMAMRAINAIDSNDSPAQDAEKTAHLMNVVMPAAADAAQPPLDEVDRMAFLAGAQEALGGNQ